jgi:lysophospholipase L1-like esterase
MAYMKDASGRRLDSFQVAGADEVGNLGRAQDIASAHGIPAPILDLNYAATMALAGFESYTRAATLDYTNALAATLTAAIDSPAFEHGVIPGTSGWRAPLGMKAAGSGYARCNPSAIIPATDEFTLVVDVNRPESYTGSGAIVSLHSGSVTHRVEVGVNGTYQPYAVVQRNGSVQYNVSLGAANGWYGRARRLVLSVKTGAFVFADTGNIVHSQASGTAPSRANLTSLDIGGNGGNASFFTGWVPRVQLLPRALTADEALTLSAAPTPLATWGDSLTDGTGATGNSGRYPDVLRATRWPVSGVYEGGVGGETSTQIRGRMVADTIRNDWTTVLWAGRNNYSALETVLSDVEAMTDHLTHSRFVVLSVINKASGQDEDAGSAGHTQIVALNAALATRYPNNYLDIRSLIVAASGGTNDAPNPTWMSDGLHLNNTGYAFVADQVGRFLGARGWF